jgi:cation-transporting ATPase E
VPAAFSIAALGLGVYLFYMQTTGDVTIARSALTAVGVMCGGALIPFVEPPTRFWTGGDTLSGDWRPTFMALGMLALYVVGLLVPMARQFFELPPLALQDVLIIGLAVVVWAFILRFIWRANLLERLLGTG